MPVPNQESKQSCICVRGIDFSSFYDFSIGFWKCSCSVVSFIFHSATVMELVKFFFLFQYPFQKTVWRCSTGNQSSVW